MLAEISFIYNLVGFLYQFFKNEDDKEEDFDSTERWVAEQLMEFEIAEREKHPLDMNLKVSEVPRNTSCFHRSGFITFIDYPNILIDGNLYYDISSCQLSLNLDDKITYLGFKDETDNIVITRILQNHGKVWESWDGDNVEETAFKIIDHVIIAEVDSREKRLVYLKENDLKFSLDDVEGTMIPIAGDWLELNCSVQLDDDKLYNITGSQVLTVLSFKPLRSKIKSAVVTEWDGTEGICDRQIYFNKQCLPNGAFVSVGQKVVIEAIESNQGSFAWRVIKLMTTGQPPKPIVEVNNSYDNSTLSLENEKGLEITYPIKFDKVKFKETAKLALQITNRSNEAHVLNKWLIPSKKKDSQLCVLPCLFNPYKLYPDQTFALNITCKPKFLGVAKENIVLLFKGFKVERIIEINVVTDDDSWRSNHADNFNFVSFNDRMAQMIRVRQNNPDDIVPAPKQRRNPHFVAGKFGMFPIPERIWNVVLGDSTQVMLSSDFDRILSRIEDKLPCLTQDLNINNYTDRWHNLLFMEEIQENIQIRVHDKQQTFLLKCDDCLALEVSGLSEMRPSLVLGDKAVVKDIWGDRPSRYEGHIHEIRGNLVLMKFSWQFQESYSGSDVSIEFHFSRTKYRKAHQAINDAISNLGHEILFPTRVLGRESQLPPEKIDSIQWFNKKLNDYQKAAVSNILLGQCRPKPYLIYGPPGTGKTITVVETILQILTNLPDSRILVATPSNSAANIITERLIQYKKHISNSFTRCVAHNLVDSDRIPDHIKPYCITLEIARDGTSSAKQGFQNGVRTQCQKSFVGRHRVTIGTCNTLGTLKLMGFAKGHFTHIIVDEAGQTTEPEIMITLTFTDKENGQIILAGDPMQLGPIVLSRYAQEFDMQESYLCRLLETFPYQKDFTAYSNGFNEKLVTKLNDNYRSLKNVITLPSEMFYDCSLVPKIDPNQVWIQKIVKVMNNIFDSCDSDTGGIYVSGIRGENAKAKDSPSWYNPHEAATVAMTTCKLYKEGISADDIGIITPYIAQIKYLRIVFESIGLPEPKIGTVEEFQGQERPLIIISTVRSSCAQLEEDLKNRLGFVKNGRRLNVAITRAHVAVLLVGDPHLLCTDPLWSQIIAQAVREDKYMGCDLPTQFGENRN